MKGKAGEVGALEAPGGFDEETALYLMQSCGYSQKDLMRDVEERQEREGVQSSPTGGASRLDVRGLIKLSKTRCVNTSMTSFTFEEKQPEWVPNTQDSLGASVLSLSTSTFGIMTATGSERERQSEMSKVSHEGAGSNVFSMRSALTAMPDSPTPLTPLSVDESTFLASCGYSVFGGANTSSTVSPSKRGATPAPLSHRRNPGDADDGCTSPGRRRVGFEVQNRSRMLTPRSMSKDWSAYGSDASERSYDPMSASETQSESGTPVPRPPHTRPRHHRPSPHAHAANRRHSMPMKARQGGVGQDTLADLPENAIGTGDESPPDPFFRPTLRPPPQGRRRRTASFGQGGLQTVRVAQQQQQPQQPQQIPQSPGPLCDLELNASPGAGGEPDDSVTQFSIDRTHLDLERDIQSRSNEPSSGFSMTESPWVLTEQTAEQGPEHTASAHPMSNASTLSMQVSEASRTERS